MRVTLSYVELICVTVIYYIRNHYFSYRYINIPTKNVTVVVKYEL